MDVEKVSSQNRGRLGMRAKNLVKAARRLSEKCGGKVPKTATVFLEATPVLFLSDSWPATPCIGGTT